jgi:hypothetical protein
MAEVVRPSRACIQRHRELLRDRLRGKPNLPGHDSLRPRCVLRPWTLIGENAFYPSLPIHPRKHPNLCNG